MALLIDINGTRPGAADAMIIGIGDTGLLGTDYCLFTVSPTPSTATVTINGEVRNSVAVEKGTAVTWSAECDGYVTQSGSETVTADRTAAVTLEEVTYTFAIVPTPSTATVTINGTVRTSVKAAKGTVISYEVSCDGYLTQSGTYTMGGADYTLAVTLTAQYTFSITAIPSNATVTINGTVRSSITVDAGTEVSYEVSCDGYLTQSGTYTMTSDHTLSITLVEITDTTVTYADIPAGGGTVTPSVTGTYGTTYSYSGTGVDASTGAVSADSLGTTVKSRTRITTVTVTPTLDGTAGDPVTVDVYQEANDASCGPICDASCNGTTLAEASDGNEVWLPAEGGTYAIVPSATQTVTYTSGATGSGEVTCALSVDTGCEGFSLDAEAGTVTADENVSTDTRGRMRVRLEFAGDGGETLTRYMNFYQYAAGTVMAAFTLNADPADATVIINGTKMSSDNGTYSVEVVNGSTVTWEVSKDGYVTQSGSETVTEDTVRNVALERERVFTDEFDEQFS